MSDITWVTVFRRTDDPKLSYIERRLDAMNIQHRRNGHSAHAPILQVPQDDTDAAWKLLDEDIDGERLDDMDDDDPYFNEL